MWKDSPCSKLCILLILTEPKSWKVQRNRASSPASLSKDAREHIWLRFISLSSPCHGTCCLSLLRSLHAIAISYLHRRPGSSPPSPQRKDKCIPQPELGWALTTAMWMFGRLVSGPTWCAIERYKHKHILCAYLGALTSVDCYGTGLMLEIKSDHSLLTSHHDFPQQDGNKKNLVIHMRIQTYKVKFYLPSF